MHNCYISVQLAVLVASFPGPTQLSVACIAETWEWSVIFYHVMSE